MQTKLFFQSIECLWTKHSKWQSSLGFELIEWWKYTTNFECCSTRSHFSAINLNSFSIYILMGWNWYSMRKLKAVMDIELNLYAKISGFNFNELIEILKILLRYCIPVGTKEKRTLLEEMWTAILKCFQWWNFPCRPDNQALYFDVEIFTKTKSILRENNFENCYRSR